VKWIGGTEKKGVPATAPYEVVDVHALRALMRGDASEAQQKRALSWIINHAAATYDLSYRAGQDGDRDTIFAEGRRYVGLQIVHLINSVDVKQLGEKSHG
jgi:hypothetical protein